MHLPRDDFVVTRAPPPSCHPRADTHSRLSVLLHVTLPLVWWGAVRKAGRLLQAYQNFFQEMRASALVAGFERGFYGEVDRARHSEMLTRARDGRAVARKRSDELVRKALH